MEARAAAVGVPEGTLRYIFPNNGQWLNDADGAAAEKLGLGTQLVSDIHLGGGGCGFGRNMDAPKDSNLSHTVSLAKPIACCRRLLPTCSTAAKATPQASQTSSRPPGRFACPRNVW